MAATLIPYTYADRATANSYGTLAEFNAYLANRINAPTFADDNAKTIALIEATRRLEAENYVGDITYGDSRLKWPRSGLPDIDGRDYADGVIPEAIKNGQFEAAIYVNEVDITEIPDTINYTEAKVGELSAKLKTTQLSSSDTLNAAVWQWIGPFLDWSRNAMRVSR